MAPGRIAARHMARAVVQVHSRSRLALECLQRTAHSFELALQQLTYLLSVLEM